MQGQEDLEGLAFNEHSQVPNKLDRFVLFYEQDPVVLFFFLLHALCAASQDGSGSLGTK